MGKTIEAGIPPSKDKNRIAFEKRCEIMTKKLLLDVNQARNKVRTFFVKAVKRTEEDMDVDINALFKNWEAKLPSCSEYGSIDARGSVNWTESPGSRPVETQLAWRRAVGMKADARRSRRTKSRRSNRRKREDE